MAAKKKQVMKNESEMVEIWRKPLQVPPRTNVMRSFYQKVEESSSDTVAQENQPASKNEEIDSVIKNNHRISPQSTPEKFESEKVEAIQKIAQPIEAAENEIVFEREKSAINKLSQEDLSRKLGIEIEDLFDVHELLRGKSFDIYQTLLKSADEKGRCKITQLELMKRTGIKNRRTFYKHEDWLINLKLLEKRHLPGDHKGVVYRVLQMSEVLPISGEMLGKFTNRLINIE